MTILVPKRFREIRRKKGPLFFLAGPVRGGSDWQAKFCKRAKRLLPRFHAAIPYYHKTGVHFPLLRKAAKGEEGCFERQLDWERFYMRLAATEGCLVFWLPIESKDDPRPPEDGPYAMDTRGELGEIRGDMKHDHTLRVVIGADPGFHGLDQIQRNFNSALGRTMPIYGTLAATVDAAVRKVSRGYREV